MTSMKKITGKKIAASTLAAAFAIALASAVAAPTSVSAILVTDADAAAVASSACTELTLDLAVGSSDNSKKEVTKMQQFLKSKGYLTAEPNGYFGPATQIAVRKFQTANQLPAVGTVGPLTRTVIRKASCESSGTSGSATVSNSTSAPVAAAIEPSKSTQVTTTTVASPKGGDIITSAQTLPIRWRAQKGISYDVILEDSKGVSQGYIISGRYELDTFSWKIGQVMKSQGSDNDFVSPGEYRIRVVDANRSAIIADQVSGIFTIKEKPLGLISVLPPSVTADSESSIVLYGNGFNKLTTVRFDSMARYTVQPSTVSKDGRLILFTLPSDIRAGQHTIDIYNNYVNASSTPSNSLSIIVNSK